VFKFRIILILSLVSLISSAQTRVIDKVIAVVGKYPVLLSDLQNALSEQEDGEIEPDRCRIFEMLVFQKLLIAQADRDSVTVSDQEIETELNRRMAYYISKFGSEEKLEAFYGKRTNVLKDDFRAEVQEQLIADKMHGRITGNIKLTPAEIKRFYNTLPEDSLPLIDSEVELQQLVKKPAYSEAAKQDAKQLIESYRERVIKGQSSMSTLARLYSEDPGSAMDGGLITNVARGNMVPEFESVAFRLKTGEVSKVFETTYGYHFIELLQRRGELLDLRHILIIPKMSNTDFFRCKQQTDSIYTAIKNGSISFEEAVKKFSDDKETRLNGGLMINPQTASTKFDNEILSQLDKNLIVMLNSMVVGELSKPMEFPSEGKPAFRIIRLKNRIDPHKANLKDDYQKLSSMATSQKNSNYVKEWIQKRSKITYIKLDPQFNCKFENNWSFTN
jgi:peptidyl-prolyl cis-trans isomerase SurA